MLKKLLSIVLLAAAFSARATDFYVSPSGSSGGNGSITSPWDLTTAFAGPSTVKPGDTVWLRAGTYHTGGTTTKYNEFLSCSSSANVVFL